MENDRPDAKNSNEGEEDETLYISATENLANGGEITIKLEQDRKRKITIISECEPVEKRGQTGTPIRRRDSEDLRRMALVNSAIRTTSQSRSRSRSRSRGRSLIRQQNEPSSSNGRGLARTRSTSGNKLIRDRQSRSRSSLSRSRSRSRSCKRDRSQTVPAQVQNHQLEVERKENDGSFRLPTHLCNRSVIGTKASKTRPECLQLSSPLYILTEQQAIGASEKKTVQFVTKILLTSKKLDLDDRRKLYAQMVEAEYVGTSRSSNDLVNDEPEEEFQCKIFYSDKGVYIHTVQNVKKIKNGKSTNVSEEKNYTNICKTKIIGNKGKWIDGWLNVSCHESVTVVNQLYTRQELFSIGLKGNNVSGDFLISSYKSTFDPTKTTHFNEEIKFDSKNIGIVVAHKSTADMTKMWDHAMGSFGEEQCEYRELAFVFDDVEKSEKGGPSSLLSIPSTKTPAITDATTTTTANATTSSTISVPPTTPTTRSEKSSRSDTSSRRSRSRAKRHKHLNRSTSATSKFSTSKSTGKSPDRESSRRRGRSDEEPIKLSAIKAPQLNSTMNNSTLNETLYHSFPQATSTPKSPGTTKPMPLRSMVNPSDTTPNKSSLRRGAVSIRERSPAVPLEVDAKGGEVDLDKSLSTKKSASKSLSLVSGQQKNEHKRDVRSISMVSKNLDHSTVLTHAELHKARLSASSDSSKSTVSPKGILRVKETKLTREVREEKGKPAEISEKKEETVKEEKVNFRGKSPVMMTARSKSPLVTEEQFVKLSALETTHETVQIKPIKLDSASRSPGPSSSVGNSRVHTQKIQLEMLIDKKMFIVNMNMEIIAEKRPDVDICGFSFSGKKIWEKSLEWPLSSADTTSQTKTIARQASNILEDQK